MSRAEIYARLPGINQNVNGIGLICFGIWDAQLSNGYDWYSAGDNRATFLGKKKAPEALHRPLVSTLSYCSFFTEGHMGIFFGLVVIFSIVKPRILSKSPLRFLCLSKSPVHICAFMSSLFFFVFFLISILSYCLLPAPIYMPLRLSRSLALYIYDSVS